MKVRGVLKDLAANFSLLAQLSKQHVRFVQAPKRIFRVLHGIKLHNIRIQDMSLYSWDSASHAWTNIKNDIVLYGQMIHVRRGSADDRFSTCAH